MAHQENDPTNLAAGYDGDLQMFIEAPHDIDMTVLTFHRYLYRHTVTYSDDGEQHGPDSA